MSAPNPVPSPSPASVPTSESKPTGYETPLKFSDVQAAEEDELGATAPRTALCISGGGIRSATFALGALQGFADLGILQHFDYLSTVSGGGYIGSWLTGWKQRWGGLTKKHSWGKTET